MQKLIAPSGNKMATKSLIEHKLKNFFFSQHIFVGVTRVYCIAVQKKTPPPWHPIASSKSIDDTSYQFD